MTVGQLCVVKKTGDKPLLFKKMEAGAELTSYLYLVDIYIVIKYGSVIYPLKANASHQKGTNHTLFN
jgi:hypothetical protein